MGKKIDLTTTLAKVRSSISYWAQFFQFSLSNWRV